MTEEQTIALVNRDQGDNEPSYGPQTRDTFQMADVFILQRPKATDSLDRFLRLIFGDPLVTPTRDEHAMFMAYSASLPSADLSRQVGAVLRKEGVGIVGAGCNDVPAPGGGVYWPDDPAFDSRDFRFPRQNGGSGGHDSNERHKRDIAEDVLRRVKDDVAAAIKRVCDECEKDSDAAGDAGGTKAGDLRVFADDELSTLEATMRSSILQTRVFDITEFGRAVHAEMDALLSCSRNGTSARGATLLCTTFLCHNCAKHLVAAGVRRVVYIEPYPKSQTLVLHRDSVMLDESCSCGSETSIENLGSERSHVETRRKVVFQPFIGIGPRRFIDFFSMRLSSGLPVQRKDKHTGDAVTWTKTGAQIRVPMSARSYLEREDAVVTLVSELAEKK